MLLSFSLLLMLMPLLPAVSQVIVILTLATPTFIANLLLCWEFGHILLATPQGSRRLSWFAVLLLPP